MPPLFFVDESGVPLTNDTLATPSREEVTDCAWDMHQLARLAEEQARRQSTPQYHPFTLHHTYTGEGCAICGTEKSNHS